MYYQAVPVGWVWMRWKGFLSWDYFSCTLTGLWDGEYTSTEIEYCTAAMQIPPLSLALSLPLVHLTRHPFALPSRRSIYTPIDSTRVSHTDLVAAGGVCRVCFSWLQTQDRQTGVSKFLFKNKKKNNISSNLCLGDCDEALFWNIKWVYVYLSSKWAREAASYLCLCCWCCTCWALQAAPGSPVGRHWLCQGRGAWDSWGGCSPLQYIQCQTPAAGQQEERTGRRPGPEGRHRPARHLRRAAAAALVVSWARKLSRSSDS